MAARRKTTTPQPVEPDRSVEELQEIAAAQRRALFDALGEAYSNKLDEDMGVLHNQFVVFIATAKIPLPNVLMVLEILEREIIDQARQQYLGQ